MDATTLLDEMVDIVLMKREIWQTNLLAKVKLEPETIRLGCIRILEWLRTQSIALKVKSLTLNENSILDQSCVLLIEKDKYYFGKLFQIKDGSLMFSDSLEHEQALEMILRARDKYNPPVIQ